VHSPSAILQSSRYGATHRLSNQRLASISKLWPSTISNINNHKSSEWILLECRILWHLSFSNPIEWTSVLPVFPHKSTIHIPYFGSMALRHFGLWCFRIFRNTTPQKP
jgi:hypothetical protein